jgi:hypothetical protein
MLEISDKALKGRFTKELHFSFRLGFDRLNGDVRDLFGADLRRDGNGRLQPHLLLFMHPEVDGHVLGLPHLPD